MVMPTEVKKANANGEYPTRDDIAIALENLQKQLDQRFECQKEVSEVQLVERDKAVQTAFKDLNKAIEEGDRSLREHVKNQVTQLRDAATAADLLELARVESTVKEIAAVRKEIELVNTANAKAIEKAEKAQKDLLDANAEKIGGLNDRLNRSDGNRQGVSQLWGIIVGAIGLLAVILAIFASFNPSDEIERNREEIESLQQEVRNRDQSQRP